ncbi:MAG: hypothetical protein OEX02_12210, partial [Cyclobacteriaceae bacterium]|nr:hypothetical protein [Cyclobacteriaceae bacterium]
MKNRLTILFIIFQVTTTLGQMHISSVPRPVKKQIANQRTEAEHLFLPFWDDFSTSVNNPDPSKWENSDDVFISDGLGIKPPTLNVASFDGLDAAGKAYSQDPLSDGITDILTSRLIDLSNLFISDDVFFSFFYQIKGNGEIPNDNDSLRLEFKDLNGSWNKIWSVSG